jgi:hypothetical protein
MTLQVERSDVVAYVRSRPGYWPTTGHLELSTRAGYSYYLDKHFLPGFGAMPMRRITPAVIQSWVNDATQVEVARKNSPTGQRCFVKTTSAPCRDRFQPTLAPRMPTPMTATRLGRCTDPILTNDPLGQRSHRHASQVPVRPSSKP